MAPQQPHRTAGSYEPDAGDATYVTGVTRAIGEDAEDAEVAEVAEVTDLGWATEVTYPDGGQDGHGEARAAERSAERAAALADTEGFHPLRIRPYVPGDPDDTLGGTTARPLIDVDPDGGPATTDLSLFAAEYADDGTYRAEHRAADDFAAQAAHGRHRRRRRGLVVAAAAVAASALAAGAVAVTGSVMGEEPKGERAMPEPSAATPDVTLPADAAPGAVTQPVPVTQHPMRATTTPAPKLTPSASVTPSATASASASTPVAPPPGSATTPASQSPTAPATSASSDVLQIGASGPAVVDLQKRLAVALGGTYRSDDDGVYDQGVADAVARFQNWYGLSADPKGVYGPTTRAALVSATDWYFSDGDGSGHGHRH